MNSISETSAEPVYRWVIVSASALMLALSMGMIVNGTSVFFIPLFDEFGWQRGDVSLINTSGLVGLAIGGIFMGRIADKTPIHWVILFGATVIGLCMLGASQADALWQFYLLFFILTFDFSFHIPIIQLLFILLLSMNYNKSYILSRKNNK